MEFDQAASWVPDHRLVSARDVGGGQQRILMTEQRAETERRLTRQLEQTRLRTIVERMADGIVIVKRDGAIQSPS